MISQISRLSAGCSTVRFSLCFSVPSNLFARDCSKNTITWHQWTSPRSHAAKLHGVITNLSSMKGENTQYFDGRIADYTKSLHLVEFRVCHLRAAHDIYVYIATPITTEKKHGSLELYADIFA